MDEKPIKVVLDTNIIVSALGFGGKPREILQQVLETKINAITSPILLAELEDVITKKFPLLSPHFEQINRQIKQRFKIVRPQVSLRVVNDGDDNRVLEAAVEGKCNFIITGDKELLDLKAFKNIKILTTGSFLELKTA